MMQEQIRRVVGQGNAEIVSEVKQGIAYREIIEKEEAERVELIVIGSRGKTGLLGHLGSVADRVSRAAKCPVLIVKGK
jgi:nucleotide-binding universal stress UspA family protein